MFDWICAVIFVGDTQQPSLTVVNIRVGVNSILNKPICVVIFVGLMMVGTVSCLLT